LTARERWTGCPSMMSEDDAAVIMEQVLTVGDKHVGVHFSSEGREVHGPFGGDRGYHVDRVSG
jgi:hypothetical protein